MLTNSKNFSSIYIDSDTDFYGWRKGVQVLNNTLKHEIILISVDNASRQTSTVIN